jgi:hypothetical protein
MHMGVYALRGKNNIHDADADATNMSQQRTKRSAYGGEKWHMQRRSSPRTVDIIG